MVADWFSIRDDGPADETLEQFIVRQGLAFLASGTQTVDSGIVIPDYPDECTEYTATIDDSKSNAEAYTKELEALLTFASFADPLFGARATAVCTAASMSIDFQAAAL